MTCDRCSTCRRLSLTPWSWWLATVCMMRGVRAGLQLSTREGTRRGRAVARREGRGEEHSGEKLEDY